VTWQTWVINGIWVIQITVAIFIVFELFVLKKTKFFIMVSYVTGKTMVHIARSYFFIYMPDIPTDIIFFGVFVPLYSFVFIRFVSADKSIKIIFWVVLLYALGIISHVLAFIVYFLIFGEYLHFDFITTQAMYAAFIGTSITILLYLVFFFIWKRYIGSIRSDIPNIGAFLVIIGGQLIFTMNQMFTLLSQRVEVDPWSAVGMIIMVIGNLAILQILLTISKKKEAEEQLKEVQHIRELEQMHYASIEARRQEMLKIRHDFNNQLAAVHQLTMSDKKEHAEELFDEIKQSVAMTTENTYCQNAIVNAVLTDKQKECDSADIQLETEIYLDENCKVTPLHLCSIFTNLLDNAIRACKALPKEKRKIEIRTAVKGAYLHIKCVNPIADNPEKERRDKGYGIIILSDIASHYKGNFTAERENDMFVAMMSVHYAL